MIAASATGAAVGFRRNRSRRIAGVAVAVSTAAALSAGCAAGQIAQTADQKSTIDGINKSVGAIDLRAVAVEAPPNLRTSYTKGGSAALKIVLVNNARTADRLVGISTSAAGGWAAYASQQQAFSVLQASNGDAPTAGAASSPSDSGSASGTESPSGSESPASSESASSTEPSSESPTAPSTSAPTTASLPAGVQSVTIPAGGRAGFGTPESTGALLLTKLTGTLRPADTIAVTFTFANAGSVRVPVTVQVADLGRTNAVGEPDEDGS